MSTEAQLDQLSSPITQERRDAIKALIKHPNDEITTAIRERLSRDTEPAVRASAAKALGRLQGDEINAALLAACDDASPSVRAAAITALGKVRPEGIEERLIAKLTSEDGDTEPVVLAIIKALGKLLNAEAIQYLLPLANHDNEAVQRAARNALGKFGATIETIDQATLKPNTTYGYTELEDFSQSLRLLISTLYAPDERRRNQASMALGRSKNVSVLGPLIRTIHRTNHGIHSVRQIVNSIADHRERFALLRALLHDPLPRRNLWPALCAILDDWPEQERDLAISYVDDHIANWDDRDRNMVYKRVDEYLEGELLPSSVLAKRIELAMWGETDVVQRRLSQLNKAEIIKQLTQIQLWGEALTSDIFEIFLRTLPENQLKTFELLYTSMDDSGLEQLGLYQNRLPALESLLLTVKLQHSNKALREMVKRPEFSMVQELRIRKEWHGNQISLAPLVECFASSDNCKVETLSIDNYWSGTNGFDGRELQQLCDTRSWQQVKELSLAHQFRNEDAIRKALQAGKMSQLTSLSINQINGTTSFVRALLQTSFDELQKLTLQNFNMQDAELRRLSRWPQLRTIEHLDFYGNEFTLQGYQTLVKSEYLTSLKQIRTNQLSAVDSFAVRKLFRDHPTLSQVTILE